MRNSKGQIMKGHIGYWRGKHHPRSKENHSNWIGDNIKYKPLHAWLNYNYKKPINCEKCGFKKRLDWALIGKEYTRDIKDYKALCRSCHLSMDKIHFSSVKVKCEQCSKEIFRNLYRIKHIKYHYCSVKCYSRHKSLLQRGINNNNYRHGRYVFEK